MNRYLCRYFWGEWNLWMSLSQPVPKALHRYRVVIFILVPGGTTNRYLRSLWYRLVTQTGTLDSYMGYFKRNISPSQSEQLCSWDGKGVACEARGRGFKSQRKNILSHFGGLRYRLFYPVPKARAIGTTFGVPVQETGTKGQSQPVPMALFLVVEVLHVDI